jgi:hypothetical protein
MSVRLSSQLVAFLQQSWRLQTLCRLRLQITVLATAPHTIDSDSITKASNFIDHID